MSLILLGILNSQAAAAGGAAAYDLLETQVLGTAASSVTFTGLDTLAAGYQHLQIRAVARSNRAAAASSLVGFRFNSDTGSNYSWHELIGSGSSVSSDAGTSATSMAYLWRIAGPTADADAYGAMVGDLLDFSDTNKYSTFRLLQGSMHGASQVEIGLGSGLWMNTAAVTSIDIIEGFGSTFTTGSRFSIYGVK